MSATELAKLEEAVLRHLELHNRLPASMGFELLRAMKELRLELERVALVVPRGGATQGQVEA